MAQNTVRGLTPFLTVPTTCSRDAVQFQMKQTAECLRSKSLPLMVYTATKTDKLIEWKLTLEYAQTAGVIPTSVTHIDTLGTVVDGPRIGVLYPWQST